MIGLKENRVALKWKFLEILKNPPEISGLFLKNPGIFMKFHVFTGFSAENLILSSACPDFRAQNLVLSSACSGFSRIPARQIYKINLNKKRIIDF